MSLQARKHLLSHVLLPIFTGSILAVMYLAGIHTVPFHPDETTNIFMADDFKSYLRNPFSLTYRTESDDSLRQHYRLIDAPLTRYIIGFGLAVQNQTPVEVDWSWSSTWEENLNIGAVPDERTLFASRISVAGLFLLTLTFAYLIGNNLFGPLAGYLTMLLTGLNALYLLHTRRAMAESTLVFSVYLVMWLLPKARRKPILLGLAAGLAFGAKQSLLPLVLVACVAVFLPAAASRKWNWKTSITNLIKFSLTFTGLFLLLNPVYWADPIGVLKTGLAARQTLLQNQIADWGNYSLWVAPAPGIIYYLVNTFYLSPAFAEASNYLHATEAQVGLYASQPLNMLMRGGIWGSVLLIIFLAGVTFVLRSLRRFGQNDQRTIYLYLVAFVLQLLFTLTFLPIPWQRYVVPTLPFILVFSAFALQEIILAVKQKLLPAKRQEQFNALQ